MSLHDPYKIEGPALISFSGGRTSGFMLRRILDAHGGHLPENVHVLFANTGKEREETLRFVADVGRHWDVPIHWVERVRGKTPLQADGQLSLLSFADEAPTTWREVDFKTASRNGEPFVTLIEERKFLPNPVTRFCTTELKIRVMKAWMIARDYLRWSNVVGIRADEPRRVARYKNRTSNERFDVVLPLATAGVSVHDVRRFWSMQPFDLHLEPWEGNCDLCFLKGAAKRKRIMRDTPHLASWWIEREQAENQQGWAPQQGDRPWSFRRDVPDYKRLLNIVQISPLLFPDGAAGDLTDLGDCECDLEAA